MTRILGCDPSTTAIGWAVLDREENKIIASGTYRPEGKTLNERMMYAFHWLHNLLKREPEVITLAIEMPVVHSTHRNVRTALVLAQMAGVLKVAALSHCGRIVEVMPFERRRILGVSTRLKAGPAKVVIVNLVNAMYPYLDLNVKQDHDAADAVAVALAAEHKLTLEEAVARATQGQ